MCPIVDGTPVDAATTNPKFLYKDTDDTATGRINLNNGNIVSGPQVTNIQRELNSQNSFTGHTSGSVYNATPTWTNNDVGTSGDNLKDRSEALTAKFNNTSGHKHTGAVGDAPQIDAFSLASVPLKGYIEQGLTLTSITGGSVDVSTQLSGKTNSTGDTVTGVVVSSPYNKVIIRQGSGASEDDVFIDGSGNVVYARLTFSASIWTLTFYVDISGTETPYSFGSSVDIKWYYQELFNPMINPPVYSEFANIPSDNPTQDVQVATTTQKGKVQLATSAQSIGTSNSSGTPNASVANEDHTHEGVHGVQEFTEAVNAYGDVILKAGTGMSIARTSNTFEFVSTGGTVAYQEVPVGTVNGVNNTFGPLTLAPIDNNSVLVFIDVVPIPLTTGFTVSGSTITFQPGYIPFAGQTVYVFYLTGGTPSVPVMSGTYRVETRTITSGEATAGSLTLAFTPSTPSYVRVEVRGGAAGQAFGIDYTVSGTTLTWASYGLDGLLASGDVLIITYVE